MSFGNRETWYRREGGGQELLRVALPLIFSNSFWAIQIAIDRVLLARQSQEAVAAAMPAVFLVWTPLQLLINTSNYATTFVAQYVGANRRERVGPAVWQSLYFSAFAGVAFLGFLPLAEGMVALCGHGPAVQGLEVTYFRCMCFAGLPFLITASVTSFFSGRGASWTVLIINVTGMTVNGLLAYAWIFGRWGFPEWGIAGAGWATVTGTTVSACLGLVLMMRAHFEAEYKTRSGWRFEWGLFKRLMYFGFPNGVFCALDCLGFALFTIIVGRLGEAELAATNIAFTLNMLAFFPTLGIGQGIEVLVGQRLGQGRPDLAERTTWTGLRIAWSFMAAVAVLYVLAPGMFVFLFHGESDGAHTEAALALVPILLRFVAFYSLFDSMNAVFSFALRGAGDTRFVTAISLALSWPLLVVPTWAAWKFGWGLYAAWTFASAYVIALALIFLIRFRHGKWKSMRVIETTPIVPDLFAEAPDDLAEVAHRD